MKGNALVYQITMPLVLVAGAGAVVLFEWTLTTALMTYVSRRQYHWFMVSNEHGIIWGPVYRP